MLLALVMLVVLNALYAIGNGAFVHARAKSVATRIVAYVSSIAFIAPFVGFASLMYAVHAIPRHLADRLILGVTYVVLEVALMYLFSQMWSRLCSSLHPRTTTS